MTWALVVAIGWGILALPTGYLIGRGLLRADRTSAIAGSVRHTGTPAASPSVPAEQRRPSGVGKPVA